METETSKLLNSVEGVAQVLTKLHLAADKRFKVNDVIKHEFGSQSIYIIDGKFKTGSNQKGLWRDTIGILVEYEGANFPKFILTYKALIKFFGKNHWLDKNEALRRVDTDQLPDWLNSRYSLYLSPQLPPEIVNPLFVGDATEHLKEVLINTTHIHRVCANQNFVSYYIIGKLNAFPQTEYEEIKSKSHILAKAFTPKTS